MQISQSSFFSFFFLLFFTMNAVNDNSSNYDSSEIFIKKQKLEDELKERENKINTLNLVSSKSLDEAKKYLEGGLLLGLLVPIGIIIGTTYAGRSAIQNARIYLHEFQINLIKKRLDENKQNDYALKKKEKKDLEMSLRQREAKIKTLSDDSAISSDNARIGLIVGLTMGLISPLLIPFSLGVGIGCAGEAVIEKGHMYWNKFKVNSIKKDLEQLNK